MDIQDVHPGQLIGTVSQLVLQGPIGEQDLAIGGGDQDHVGDRLEEGPEVGFTFSEFLLNPLELHEQTATPPDMEQQEGDQDTLQQQPVDEQPALSPARRLDADGLGIDRLLQLLLVMPEVLGLVTAGRDVVDEGEEEGPAVEGEGV